MNRNKLSLNSSLQKAAELSGAAGEFRCYSLHRSQISQDLRAMQARPLDSAGSPAKTLHGSVLPSEIPRAIRQFDAPGSGAPAAQKRSSTPPIPDKLPHLVAGKSRL